MFEMCTAGFIYRCERTHSKKKARKDRGGDIFRVIISTWDAVGAFDMFMPTDANAGTLQKVWIHAWPCLGVVCCTCKQRWRGEGAMEGGGGKKVGGEWRGKAEERGERAREEEEGEGGG